MLSYGFSYVWDDCERGQFQVNRKLMVMPEVHADERRLLDRCWLFVGHESEIERPGDFACRMVGGRPLILIRDGKGVPRVFFNLCTHRGALLCRNDQGNTEELQCVDHAWTFDTAGSLVSVTDPDGYGTAFNPAKFALKVPLHVDEYRGLFFVSYDPDQSLSLGEYLGAARPYIDLALDQAYDGFLQTKATTSIMAANWKLQLQNSIDFYHAAFPFRTDDVGTTGRDRTPAGVYVDVGRDVGNGHSVIEISPDWDRIIAPSPALGPAAHTEFEARNAEFAKRYGTEREWRMLATFRRVHIFPNLIIDNAPLLKFLRVEPIAPDRSLAETWTLIPRGQSAHSIRIRHRLNVMLGTGRRPSRDDIRALERAQQGCNTAEVTWSDVSRGMSRTPRARDELQIRTFWRAYASMMNTGDFPARVVDVEAPAAAPTYASE